MECPINRGGQRAGDLLACAMEGGCGDVNWASEMAGRERFGALPLLMEGMAGSVELDRGMGSFLLFFFFSSSFLSITQPLITWKQGHRISLSVCLSVSLFFSLSFFFFSFPSSGKHTTAPHPRHITPPGSHRANGKGLNNVCCLHKESQLALNCRKPHFSAPSEKGLTPHSLHTPEARQDRALAH